MKTLTHVISDDIDQEELEEAEDASLLFTYKQNIGHISVHNY